jgi:hypothetical protein
MIPTMVLPSQVNLLLQAARAASQGFARGVNFTSEGGAAYGTPEARAMLEKLPAKGVNSVAIVPYGFTPAGQPIVRLAGSRSLESDEGVRDIALHAKRLKLQVLMKPHIWTRGGYPGGLEYPDPAARKQWFAQYAVFVEHYARMSAAVNADVFCVGNEFVRLSREDQQWRQLIALARTHFKGKIAYSATQGEEFEQLKFWDAVDYIGLSNYYPLPDSLDASGIVAKVEAVQRKFQKPVLLTEAGFVSMQAPHRAPWDESPRLLSMDDQARCVEALFKAFYRKPWLQGMYWWKVGTNGYGGPLDGSHTPWGKPAMDVIARWYRSGTR